MEAINVAGDLYSSRYDKPDYGRIMGTLPVMDDLLSWERSVEEYCQWYDKACGQQG